MTNKLHHWSWAAETLLVDMCALHTAHCADKSGSDKDVSFKSVYFVGVTLGVYNILCPLWIQLLTARKLKAWCSIFTLWCLSLPIWCPHTNTCTDSLFAGIWLATPAKGCDHWLYHGATIGVTFPHLIFIRHACNPDMHLILCRLRWNKKTTEHQ